MNMLPKPVQVRTVLCASVMALLSAACATTGGEPGSSNASNARSALNALKADGALAGLAPAAMQEAEAAVRRAEMTTSNDDTERDHLGYLAEVKVEIARAEAERRQAEARTQVLTAEREQQEAAARERAAEEQARAEAARRAEQEAALRAEMEALKFKEVERGFVLTLSGGTLFASGKWDIKPGVAKNLDRVAEFLAKYPERQVTVEGHTDSQGKDDYNLKLSQRRADSVKNYLVGHGVAAERITPVGKGESLPVADNKTAEGRQHNRRVEIVIAN
jgi:outer membrane protein OmpA-like peptidoglycan-associated protein